MTETPKRKKFRIQDFFEAKAQGKKISMLTAYDSLTAAIFDAAGVEVLLVGDSLGDNMLSHPSTIPVTLDEMIIATRSVARANKYAFVVADLPFGTYEASATQAHASAVRLVKEGYANAVKLEGGAEKRAQVELLTQSGIPVMGHLGLTPQAENMLGGKKIQGVSPRAKDKLISDAIALSEAGVCGIVLELIPAALAAEVTAEIKVPTIGIGAGKDVDGQVLVWTDMAGMRAWSPRFARRFAELGIALQEAAGQYVDSVKDGSFPTEKYSV